MEAIIHFPEDQNEILKINKEIADVYTRAAIKVVSSLKLSPKQLDNFYEELEQEILKVKTA